MKNHFEPVHPELQRTSRQRQTKACKPCREKKTKCNAGNPCEACFKRRNPGGCAYDTDTTTRFNDQPGLAICLAQLGASAIQRRISSASVQEVAIALRNTADFEYQLQISHLSSLNIGNTAKYTLPTFFGLGDPISSMLHAGRLLNEWNNFITYPEAWSQAEGLSLMALVYGCLTLTAFYAGRLGKDLPGHLGPPSQTLEAFVDRSHQCFCHIDLETPGKYKVEAAIIRIAVLIYCKPDMKRGFAALAQAVGLAQSSGYANPRDTSMVDLGLSEMEVEYRKRAWDNLQSLKYHVSFYYNQIQTIRPEPKNEVLTNLLDIDMPLGDRAVLPPPRPLTHLTPVLPLILKRELQRVSTEIGLAIFCRESITLKEIDRFDIQLDDIYRKVSTPLLIGSVLQVSTLKYSLPTIYHSAKIVLHRWSLLAENLNEQGLHAGKSRLQCVSSAVEVLKIQKALLENRRSGQERWELDPLIMYDFLLATTIVCLELSHPIQSMRPTTTEGDTIRTPTAELCYWLESSIDFWQEAGAYGVPPEAQWLCAIFRGVLQRAYPTYAPTNETLGLLAENASCSSSDVSATSQSFDGNNYDLSADAVVWNLAGSSNIWDDPGNRIMQLYPEWTSAPDQQG